MWWLSRCCRAGHRRAVPRASAVAGRRAAARTGRRGRDRRKCVVDRRTPTRGPGLGRQRQAPRAGRRRLPGRVHVDGFSGSGFSDAASRCGGVSYAARAAVAWPPTRAALVVVRAGSTTSTAPTRDRARLRRAPDASRRAPACSSWARRRRPTGPPTSPGSTGCSPRPRRPTARLPLDG